MREKTQDRFRFYFRSYTSLLKTWSAVALMGSTFSAVLPIASANQRSAKTRVACLNSFEPNTLSTQAFEEAFDGLLIGSKKSVTDNRHESKVIWSESAQIDFLNQVRVILAKWKIPIELRDQPSNPETQEFVTDTLYWPSIEATYPDGFTRSAAIRARLYDVVEKGWKIADHPHDVLINPVPLGIGRSVHLKDQEFRKFEFKVRKYGKHGVVEKPGVILPTQQIFKIMKNKRSLERYRRKHLRAATTNEATHEALAGQMLRRLGRLHSDPNIVLGPPVAKTRYKRTAYQIIFYAVYPDKTVEKVPVQLTADLEVQMVRLADGAVLNFDEVDFATMSKLPAGVRIPKVVQEFKVPDEYKNMTDDALRALKLDALVELRTLYSSTPEVDGTKRDSGKRSHGARAFNKIEQLIALIGT